MKSITSTATRCVGFMNPGFPEPLGSKASVSVTRDQEWWIQQLTIKSKMFIEKFLIS